MISLYDMLEAADGQLFGEAAAHIFTDFAFELSQVDQGCLFVALKTEHGDGHQFIEQAIARGALGIICSQPPGVATDGVTVMIVRDAVQALLNWARIVMEKYGTAVVAVTGAVGKSTTAAAIEAVLATRYKVYRGTRSRAGRLGLPLSLGRLGQQHDLAVVELATEQAGEMAELMGIAHPLIGVVTSGYGPAGWPDGYEHLVDEQAALVRHLPEDGIAVLNYDDPGVRNLEDHTRASIFSYGIDSFDADLTAYNTVIGRYKTGFDLRYAGERFVGKWVPLLGRHQLFAVMAALAVGLSYQVSVEDGLRALTQLEPLPGRLRPLNGVGGCLLVDDTNSASEQSTIAALEWLGSVREDQGRLIFVMGDLSYPGGLAHRAHHQLGDRVTAIADVLVTQGNLAAIAGRAALDYGMIPNQVRMTYSHRDAAAVLRDHLGPNDVVLVKGSRMSGMGAVVRALLQDEADAELVAGHGAVWDRGWAVRSIRPSWVEVDLDATASNVRQLCESIGHNVALMAMVPADAYGHGAVAVGSTAMLNGATYLGVGSLDEAVALRDAGIDAPILIKGYISPWALRDAVHHDLTVALYDLEMARLGNRIASEMRRKLRVHINIDTGMRRLGLLPERVMDFFRALKPLTELEIEGLYTDLAAAGEDEAYTRDQLAVFSELLMPLIASEMRFRYIHAADTTALLMIPGSHFSMVRAGSALYGLAPGGTIGLPAGLAPTLAWKTVIAQVKTLTRSGYVGSGKQYWGEAGQRVAVIPVGYADGLRGNPYPWQEVLVHGQRAPVIGHIGMHEATLDLTNAPGARVGDAVVLIGAQGADAITVEEVAMWLRVNLYQVLSTILPRTPRL